MLPRFEIFGIALYSYPLLMGAAWGLAMQVAKLLNSRQETPFRFLNLYLLGVFVSAWAGAKIFYLLTADVHGKEAAISSANFWLGGGFVFYGGLIFGLLFTLLFAVRTRQAIYKFNIFAPALAIGHGVGRIGCFLAGCCYGAAYEGIGAVHMHGLDRYPTQLLEAGALLLFGLYSMKPSIQKRRMLVLEYLVFYALVRFLLEFLRGDGIRGVWALGASSSQIVSFFVLLFCAGGYLASALSKVSHSR